MTVTNHMTVRQAAEGRTERGYSEAGILSSKLHGAAPASDRLVMATQVMTTTQVML